MVLKSLFQWRSGKLLRVPVAAATPPEHRWNNLPQSCRNNTTEQHFSRAHCCAQLFLSPQGLAKPPKVLRTAVFASSGVSQTLWGVMCPTLFAPPPPRGHGVIATDFTLWKFARLGRNYLDWIPQKPWLFISGGIYVRSILAKSHSNKKAEEM